MNNEQRDNALSVLEAQLLVARDIAELNTGLQEYLKKLAIITFSFTYYSYYPNSLNQLKFDFASANFESWHKHYINEHYEEIDSTLEVVYQASLPIYWDLQEQLKNAKNSKERQMRLDSIAFGAEKGISIPIHGPQEDFAIFLVVQMTGETCLNHWQDLQHTLFAAGYYYYSHLKLLLLTQQKPAEKYNLKKREMQCLELIAKRHSVRAIATLLSITERTVNYHVQRMNKKLGVKNKYQAVAIAIQNNLIKP